MTGCPSEDNTPFFPITINQGASYRQLFTWKDAAGEPIDLTGCTAEMQCRANINSATPFLTLTTENDRITLGDDEGTILLEVDAETTAALTAALPGVYDLLITFPSGFVKRLLRGDVTVSRGVTR